MTLNISRCRERCGWHLQLGSTTLFRLRFRISTSAKRPIIEGLEPSSRISCGISTKDTKDGRGSIQDREEGTELE